MNWRQLRTILWLRWRLSRNQWSRGGLLNAVLTMIVAVALLVLGIISGFAGVMVAPILSVEPGMGDSILILAFVVIVIGGIGSIRGAFLGALLIGLVDTLGRSFSVDLLRLFLDPSSARTVGPALASMLIYLLMALVLFMRPAGLFPALTRTMRSPLTSSLPLDFSAVINLFLMLIFM